MIRLARVGDGPQLSDIYRPSVVDSFTSFELEAPDGAEMERRIERVLQRYPWLVYEAGGEIVGYAYASAHRERAAYQWSVEVSAYVRGDMHRRGVARALYDSLFAVLTRQGFCNAYAGVALPNDASVRFHEALGFTPVGVFRGVGHKLGAWHDVAWYERSLAPRTEEPPPPIPLTLAVSAGWFSEPIRRQATLE